MTTPGVEMASFLDSNVVLDAMGMTTGSARSPSRCWPSSHNERQQSKKANKSGWKRWTVFFDQVRGYLTTPIR